MNSREKKLTIVFGTILLVMLIGGGAFKIAKSTGGGSKPLTLKLQQVKSILETKDEWEEREKWLQANVPVYASNSAASTKLLERIGKLARAHGLKIESQEIIKVDPGMDAEVGIFYQHERTEVSVGFSGNIQKMVECIHELQTPQYFTGVDRLTIENSEADGLKYRLLITQWYELENLAYNR